MQIQYQTIRRQHKLATFGGADAATKDIRVGRDCGEESHVDDDNAVAAATAAAADEDDNDLRWGLQVLMCC